MKQDFLVEIGTEELPPKALKKLRDAFKSSVEASLKEVKLSFDDMAAYAAPRRLALRVNQLELQGEDENIERRGPAKSSAYDSDGNPTAAALGFAKSCGIAMEEVGFIDTPKGEYCFYEGTKPGVNAKDILPGIIEKALKQLPIPKMMRWGDNDFSFVRPVQWILMLLGSDVVPATLYGVESGNQTFGHRFHHNKAVTISSAEEYLPALEKAKVLADFEQRRSVVRKKIEAACESPKANVVWDEALLDEVTAIVEWPVPLVCEFNADFLKVPSEALISAMQEHQKCFSLKDAKDQLINRFVAVSNIESKDPACVIAGNQKVMAARLSDAAFFFEQDLKTPLEEHLLRLEKVTFQAKLGSMADKTNRIVKLAQHIADKTGADLSLTERAAMLSKTDLMTDMVYEFTDLQGIMGEHYACHQGEDEQVSKALFEQYLPRFSGDDLPETPVGLAVSLADKIDTLTGIFGIGMKPTGSKDPFALRRAMIGVIRMCVEKSLHLDLADIFKFAHGSEQKDLINFAKDRLKVWFQDERGVKPEIVDAVLASSVGLNLADFNLRIEAVSGFAKLPEAESLAASNKRVQNILKKAPEVLPAIRPDLFAESAEGALFDAIDAKDKVLLPHLESGEYGAYLSGLVDLKPLIDDYFENVMVMCSDDAIKHNRLALLKRLHDLFFAVADISVL